ncbi:phosphatase PAP2 family protein [Corynebacterium sp. P3-F1]|uniref:acid phosphatase n=1 Tax=Corynebacterium sp. P3-F1 TaxID=3059080 RepID=UPI00265C98BF|nr:phosphatase PAP2 family protein [Corynebacterium sp. P3-F1]WKK62194.1 phosphatase PAP2 family protein [Corynebacterium sp. P3-F1]
MTKNMRVKTAVAAAMMGIATVSPSVAVAQPLQALNFQLPEGASLTAPQLKSPVTGSSTGGVPVQRPGAPVPTPFSPDYLAGYISDISPYYGGVYYQVNQLFPSVRRNHPEIMRKNLDTVVEINNNASPERIADAQVDALAASDDLLETLSPALGQEFGQAVRDALNENRLPKTQYLLGNGFLARAGGIASSTGIEKVLFHNPRPFKVAPDRIKEYNLYEDDLYGGSPSFPSGHTNQATWVTSILAYMVPEVAPQLHYRGALAGNSRIVLGVHYPLDVIGGRMSGQAAAADRLNDPKMRNAIDQAAAELRSEIEWRTGKSIPDLVASDTPFISTQDAVKQYTEWMDYGFDTIYDPNAAMIVPQSAPVLLANSYPGSDYGKRAGVLHATAGKAGNPLDWQGEGGSWQRLNLAKASAEAGSINPNGSLKIN